jgi:hypothetical protein
MVVLSRFQRFRNHTEEKAVSIKKMFVFQFINLAVLVLLVNYNLTLFQLPTFFPILTGRYDDFSVQWYKQVGTTLLFTMCSNVLTPHLAEWLLRIPFKCRRCYDRGCTRDKRRTRQLL